jgi:hypothetical protein
MFCPYFSGKMPFLMMLAFVTAAIDRPWAPVWLAVGFLALWAWRQLQRM